MLKANLGEFGLIDRIKKQIKLDPSVIVGPGDDCAVLKFNKGFYQLFTCDMLVEGVDFTGSTDPYLIGRKAIACSISDIAACGGIPRYAGISLGLPSGIALSKVDKIAKGAIELAKKYKINIIGGDISRAKSIVIDVSMLGEVEKNCFIKRSGAKAGDIILVSGKFGGSIKGKHLKFCPRVKEARYLVRNFKINSMIDVSDGLAQDLGHILKSSKKGAVIYEALIPLSPDAKSIKGALNDGEDFELLFTMPAKEANKLLSRRCRDFKAIGKITERSSGFKLESRNGKQTDLKLKGFRHF